MIAWPFIMALQLQGTVWALGARRHAGPAFCVWVGLPLGLLAWVVLNLVFLLTPLPHSPGLLLSTFGAFGLLGTAMLARSVARDGGLRGSDLRTLAACTAVVTCGAALFTAFDFTVATSDSLVMLDAGRAIAFYGAIQDGAILGSRGVLTTIAVGTPALFGEPYLAALFPALAISLAGLFVTLGVRALDASAADPTPGARPRHAALSAWAVLALFAPYFMQIHVFYLHTNLAAAVYLFGFAACFFLAEREREPAWLPFAFVLLFGFSLTRVEAPIVALVMLVIAFGPSKVDAAALARCSNAFLLALLVWELVVWRSMGEETVLLGSRLAAGMAALVGAAIPGLALLRLPALSTLRSRLPALVVATLAVGLVGAAVLDPRTVFPSALALLENATGLAWGGLWLAMAALTLGAMLRPPVAGARVFGLAALAYLLLIVLMASLRGAEYDVSWQDSGHRMLVHVAPLVMFWLLLVYAPGLDAPDFDEDRPALAHGSGPSEARP